MASCSICHWPELQPGPQKDDYTFVRCPRCGYVVASPMPDQKTLDQLYGEVHFRSSYHPEQARNRRLLEQRAVQYRQDRDYLLEFVQGGRILDYGCGNGQFMGVFPDSFTRMGYEKNRTTTSWIEENAALTVLQTDEQVDALPSCSLDVVSMRGVIEHLIDPESVVKRLSSKLRQGGHFFICATPNVDSPASLVFGTSWSQFTPPFHLHFFSPRTLAVMFARHDLVLIDYRLPYLGTPYEQVDRDVQRFQQAAKAWVEDSEVGEPPPFPGTMMSLVFRKCSAEG